ncbi:uncharacterized protein IUM83_01879 [Phytophthora cinnamomi]|uniref:uncharacterized protein n=1 Tax=Phytophthora cinnamomi TaxID=4785 RepID=UPI003559EDAB|nr:hypothetical protein IUM83_01879 [Phytophthora cinnamomi]
MSIEPEPACAATKEGQPKPEGGALRAKWELCEEFDLLERFVDARKVPALSTDNRLISAVWNDITAALNMKHKRKYKARRSRIMRDYDLFEKIKGLSVGGVCPMTSKLVLDDDVWERLDKANPNQAGKIKELYKKGFEHDIIGMMAVGTAASMVFLDWHDVGI